MQRLGKIEHLASRRSTAISLNVTIKIGTAIGTGVMRTSSTIASLFSSMASGVDWMTGSSRGTTTHTTPTTITRTTTTAVQKQLAQLGYYSGPIDGIYGPLVRDAVAKYQIAMHQDVTGSLSPETLRSFGLSQPVAS
ncbi:MAG: hypothetical protein DMF14_02850 [Verrucomicrobia bacterium]|nr:MAG: hypothetical protein DMF14_02850 [Verrucomicrobiota bacterium]